MTARRALRGWAPRARAAVSADVVLAVHDVAHGVVVLAERPLQQQLAAGVRAAHRHAPARAHQAAGPELGADAGLAERQAQVGQPHVACAAGARLGALRAPSGRTRRRGATRVCRNVTGAAFLQTGVAADCRYNTVNALPCAARAAGGGSSGAAAHSATAANALYPGQLHVARLAGVRRGEGGGQERGAGEARQ